MFTAVIYGLKLISFKVILAIELINVDDWYDCYYVKSKIMKPAFLFILVFCVLSLHAQKEKTFKEKFVKIDMSKFPIAELLQACTRYQQGL